MIKINPGTYVWGVTRHEYNYKASHYYKFFRTREEARAWIKERKIYTPIRFEKARIEKITVWVEKYTNDSAKRG